MINISKFFQDFFQLHVFISGRPYAVVAVSVREQPLYEGGIKSGSSYPPGQEPLLHIINKNR